MQRPTPQTAKDWLANATDSLSKQGIDSARLDAELILAHTLGQNRTFLHAHSDESLDGNILSNANKQLELRIKRVPIAYIHGKKEFYGREFNVTTATLIPRPESEEVINSLKELFISEQLDINNRLKLVDVGTGCGALGITAKLEFPQLEVTLTDISTKALDVARKNAKKLGANVRVNQNDLLSGYRESPDIILANLPYVSPSWNRSVETDYEPDLALFADKNGQELIEKLIIEAQQLIKPHGFIVIESDPCQHKSLIEFANKRGFSLTRQSGYVTTFQKTR